LEEVSGVFEFGLGFPDLGVYLIELCLNPPQGSRGRGGNSNVK
jgi:hypothetical protein